MLIKTQTTLGIGLCVLLAASPVLANPPPRQRQAWPA